MNSDWGWVDVDRSSIIPDETILRQPHQPNIDEIIVSRSHAGQVYQILRQVYQDAQYKVLSAAGSGLKKLHL